MINPIVEVKNISKNYGNLAVLKNVSLQIASSEIVAIVGPSGAGKSTLLHIMGSLDKPDGGDVAIKNTSLFKLSDKKLSDFRNKNIGFIFQFHHLLPELTALENVCLPAMISGKSFKEAKIIAQPTLDFLGLAHRINHKPAELSGGEQQRFSVARALINNPGIILADEPSGNLDSSNAKDLHELFFKLRDVYNQTFVIVTHNEELANMADRQIQMKDGLLIL